jgi:hypothetical protein
LKNEIVTNGLKRGELIALICKDHSGVITHEEKSKLLHSKELYDSSKNKNKKRKKKKGK